MTASATTRTEAEAAVEVLRSYLEQMPTRTWRQEVDRDLEMQALLRPLITLPYTDGIGDLDGCLCDIRYTCNDMVERFGNDREAA